MKSLLDIEALPDTGPCQRVYNTKVHVLHWSRTRTLQSTKWNIISTESTFHQERREQIVTSEEASEYVLAFEVGEYHNGSSATVYELFYLKGENYETPESFLCQYISRKCHGQKRLSTSSIATWTFETDIASAEGTSEEISPLSCTIVVKISEITLSFCWTIFQRRMPKLVI